MSRRSPSGFTLIEILAVVAIVGILLALTIPVFWRFVESARNVKCFSNLRTLGNGIMLFTQDNDGRMPPSMEDPAGPRPIFGNKVSSWGPTWAEYIAKVYLEGDKSSFKCPSRPKAWQSAVSKPAGYYLDYVYNENFSPRNKDISDYQLYEGIKLASIKSPSKKILLADGGRPSGNDWAGGFYMTKDAWYLHPRHFRDTTVNVIYVDQHVEGIPYKKEFGKLPPVDDPVGRNAFLPDA